MKTYPSTFSEIQIYIKHNAQRMVYEHKTRNSLFLSMEDAMVRSKKQYEFDIKNGTPRYSMEDLMLADQELFELNMAKNKKRMKDFVESNTF